jgi:hypothetical protein
MLSGNKLMSYASNKIHIFNLLVENTLNFFIQIVLQFGFQF